MEKLIDIPIWAVNRALHRKYAKKPLCIDKTFLEHIRKRRPNWKTKIKALCLSDEIKTPDFIGVSHNHPDGFILVYQSISQIFEGGIGLGSAFALAVKPTQPHHEFYFAGTMFPVSQEDLSSNLRKQHYQQAHLGSFSLDMTEAKRDLRELGAALAQSWQCQIKP